jgi:hypothetical protein
MCGKGSDYFLFIDGKLAVDGTGKMTSASATNAINFGDLQHSANENADVQWSYIKYYTGGMLLPTAATGSTLNEFAYWSGNKANLLPDLYNLGAPISAKQFCGLERNYVENIIQREAKRGVTNNPTTTSTSWVLLPEMEAFIIGSNISCDFIGSRFNTTTNSGYTAISADGVLDSFAYLVQQSGANATIDSNVKSSKSYVLGLHKIEVKWGCGSGTETSVGIARALLLESRS